MLSFIYFITYKKYKPSVPKKTLRVFRKDLMVFSKTVYESKISCISMSFKKEMDILRQIAKKLQTLHGSFGKTACPKC